MWSSHSSKFNEIGKSLYRVQPQLNLSLYHNKPLLRNWENLSVRKKHNLKALLVWLHIRREKKQKNTKTNRYWSITIWQIYQPTDRQNDVISLAKPILLIHTFIYVSFLLFFLSAHLGWSVHLSICLISIIDTNFFDGCDHFLFGRSCFRNELGLL